MTYQTGQLVEAIDYNNIIPFVNDQWGVGNGKIGYGQPEQILPVAVDQLVGENKWNELGNRVNVISLQKGSPLGGILVNNNNTISYYSNYGFPNIPGQVILSQRGSYLSWARLNTSPPPSIVSFSNNWRDKVTFTITYTFANANATRYFFNAGGQLSFNFFQTGVGYFSYVMAQLCNMAGTIFFSQTSPISSYVRINNVNYNGITKIGGSGSAPIITDQGYYQLKTSYTTLLQQNYNLAGDFANSNIAVKAKTNGFQTVNGDNGNILQFQIVFSMVPNAFVAGGLGVRCFINYPTNIYLQNVWGTVGFSASVTGA
jgi:hypothetical protein